MDTEVKALIEGEFVQVGLLTPMELEDYSVSFVRGWAKVLGDCILVRDKKNEAQGKPTLLVPWVNVSAVQVVHGKFIPHLREKNRETKDALEMDEE